jgi:plastocyanin domain-containing protein
VNTAEVIVTLLGIGAILWVNHYFFNLGRTRAAIATASQQGVQQVRIEVQGGYSPSVIRVEAGRPVQLNFHRTETSGCTEEVVLPDFGLRSFLPPHRTTPVQFTPTKPGSYEFTCGMGMVRGKLIVEERRKHAV